MSENSKSYTSITVLEPETERSRTVVGRIKKLNEETQTTDEKPTVIPIDQLLKAAREPQARNIMYQTILRRKAQSSNTTDEFTDEDPTQAGGDIETLDDIQRLNLTEVRVMLSTRANLPEDKKNDELRWLIKNPDLIEYKKYLLSRQKPSTEIPQPSKPRTPLSRMHQPIRKTLTKV